MTGRRAGEPPLRWWDPRFLAGVPWPERTAVDDVTLAASGARALACEVVGLDARRSGDCDLVVLTRLDAASLGHAARALRPGGSCWIEVRDWPVSVAAALASIARAGFIGVELYAPWPSRDRARAWIPVDHRRRAAPAWPLPEHEGRGPWKRRMQRLRIRCWRARLALGLGLPLVVLARRPPVGQLLASTDRGTRPALHNLRDRVDRVVFDARATGRSKARLPLRWYLSTGGGHSSNKAVAFVSDRPFDATRAVVKLPRIPGSVRPLEREAKMLQRLGAEGLPGVPRLLGLYRSRRGGIAVVETAMAGRPLQALLRSHSRRQLMETARQWLVTLARQTRGGATGLSALASRFEPLARTRVERLLLERGLAAMRDLDGLPGVVEHRDFAPWNLLLDHEGGLQVLDWESAVTCGLPGADLVYFLTYLEYYLRGTRTADEQVRGYSQLWHPSNPTGFHHHRELGTYLSDLDLGSGCSAGIRLYTWAVHTVTSWDLSEDASSADVHPRSEMFVRLWRAEASLAVGAP